jgi:hypothetical protein
MSEPLTVAVVGSCITRDNFNRRFNPGYKRWYAVGSTTNQSSMIALMSPAVDEPWEPVEEMKPYGLWNVHSDLSREILDLLPAEQPDFLVLDFFGDIHFGVLRLPDGRYVTDNRWRLHKTDLYRRLLEDPGAVALRWQDDADAYFDLWTDAMDRFAAYVAERCPRTRVVVHCGFNAVEVLRSGKRVPSPLGPAGRQGKAARAEARQGNAFWKRLNEHARTSYGWEHIDLSGEYYATFPEHPWGAFEVHYTMDYYRRFQAEMHHLALREELPADLSARVDAVSDAAAHRIQDELAWWRAAERQRARAAKEAARPRWRRMLRPGPRETLPARPGVPGDDHVQLAGLRDALDEETWERVAELPRSADDHVAWIREVEEARAARAALKRSASERS